MICTLCKTQFDEQSFDCRRWFLRQFNCSPTRLTLVKGRHSCRFARDTKRASSCIYRCRDKPTETQSDRMKAIPTVLSRTYRTFCKFSDKPTSIKEIINLLCVCQLLMWSKILGAGIYKFMIRTEKSLSQRTESVALEFGRSVWHPGIYVQNALDCTFRIV